MNPLGRTGHGPAQAQADSHGRRGVCDVQTGPLLTKERGQVPAGPSSHPPPGRGPYGELAGSRDQPDPGSGSGVLPAGMGRCDHDPRGGTAGLRPGAAPGARQPADSGNRFRSCAIRPDMCGSCRCRAAMALALLADPGRVRPWRPACASGRARTRGSYCGQPHLVRRSSGRGRRDPVRHSAHDAGRLSPLRRLGSLLNVGPSWQAGPSSSGEKQSSSSRSVTSAQPDVDARSRATPAVARAGLRCHPYRVDLVVRHGQPAGWPSPARFGVVPMSEQRRLFRHHDCSDLGVASPAW